jgi:hypothetical protein
VITYKNANGIFALRKHLEGQHRQVWVNWNQQAKRCQPKLERRITKKRFGPTLGLFFFFFLGVYVLYNKDDFHQKQFEEDLALFITKELLSFVEAPFFKRLVFK